MNEESQLARLGGLAVGAGMGDERLEGEDGGLSGAESAVAAALRAQPLHRLVHRLIELGPVGL